MIEPQAGIDAPRLIVLRANTALAERTVDALHEARRRGDRVVVAQPAGSHGAARVPAGRRLDSEQVTDDLVLTRALAHVDETGGPVVVLHDGAHGFGKRWIDDLVASLATADAALAATNAAPWPICPEDLPDSRATRTTWRDFARSLAGRPAVTLAERAEMVGPALALSPDAVRDLATNVPVMPPLEAGELARSVAACGRRVVRADDVYVHDEHTDVLLSACLIMKDEADMLERCLRSLRGVVDEVVIYDTGSTDGSVELARQLGAVVVPGTWSDDFSTARNAARSACRGTWLFHIDADEEIEDPELARDVRAVVGRDIPVDLLAVPLHNLAGTELAPVRNPTPHWVPRVLHRTRCRWTGAIHEHPMPVNGAREPRTVRDESITLVHYGYLDEVVERKDKRARNARITETRTDDDTEVGRAHFDRARTLVMNGRNEESLAEYELAAEHAASPIHRRVALEQAALVLLNLGRPDEATPWIERRAAIADAPGVPRWLRARQALAFRDHERALAELDGIADYTDNFSSNGPDSVHLMRAEALLGLHRKAEAGRELVATLAVNPAHDEAWVRVMRHADEWPDVLREAARLVPADQLKLLAGKLASAPVGLAAPTAEALWEAHPGSRTLIALGVILATHLDVEGAARWSARLRDAGMGTHHCPLHAIARDRDRDPMERLQAAYVGVERFRDVELAAMVDELAALFPMAG